MNSIVTWKTDLKKNFAGQGALEGRKQVSLHLYKKEI